MTAKFGIEIEFLGMGDDCHAIKKTLVKNGIKAQTYADQNLHPESGVWKATYDGSVCNEDNAEYPYCDECDCCSSECGCYEPIFEQGAELVSPVLPAKQSSYDEIAKVLNALNSQRCYVNDTCGLHVHVDARFISNYGAKASDFFQYLIDSYAEIEEEVDRRMNIDRREDNNNYCASMIGKKYPMILGCRYYKLNVCAFTKHGTIEFRHHHGTLDSEEIIGWVKFCLGFMKKARRNFNAKLRREHAERRKAEAAMDASLSTELAIAV